MACRLESTREILGSVSLATTDWCGVLGIERPDLAAVKDHRDANTYAQLLVALLERGEPMTLAQVAARFEEAGIAPRDRALRSLQRCQPGRAPVYRDGDHYGLDPHDDDVGLWVFRLGLTSSAQRMSARSFARSRSRPIGCASPSSARRKKA